MSENVVVAPSEESLLKMAVDNVLYGSASRALGQWQLCAYVLADAKEERSQSHAQEDVAVTIGTRFRTVIEQASSKGVPVMGDIKTAPSKQTVSAWGKIGFLLAGHVFTDASLSALRPIVTNTPGTVWNHAQRHFGNVEKATTALTADGGAEAFLLKYADIVNQLNEEAKLAKAEKAEKAKAARAAAKAEKVQANSTEPAAEPEPESELTAALNAALTKHGYDAVLKAVLPALAKLDKPAAASRRANKSGSAASA